jgi:hypothetical protein
MSPRRRPSDPLDPIRERLRQLIVVAPPEGADWRAMADVIAQEFPDDVGGLLNRSLLVEWVRREARKLRTPEGLPLVGSFNGKAVQIELWTVDMFRDAIEHYVSPARKNLRLAQGLADECERVHGVRFAVPYLSGDEAAEAM